MLAEEINTYELKIKYLLAFGTPVALSKENLLRPSVLLSYLKKYNQKR